MLWGLIISVLRHWPWTCSAHGAALWVLAFVHLFPMFPLSWGSAWASKCWPGAARAVSWALTSSWEFTCPHLAAAIYYSSAISGDLPSNILLSFSIQCLPLCLLKYCFRDGLPLPSPHQLIPGGLSFASRRRHRWAVVIGPRRRGFLQVLQPKLDASAVSSKLKAAVVSGFHLMPPPGVSTVTVDEVPFYHLLPAPPPPNMCTHIAHHYSPWRM